jgi:serine/threonine-protein kinase
MQQKILNGRYELEQKIGEGGMARVYRGRDLRLNRRIAVKVLHSHHAADAGFLRRFHHEAQAAANLHHPSVVDVYDVGQDGDIHYIVMEFVEGSDLKTLILRGGALPIEQALTIAADAADGLEAAHRLGLIHRDIKPQNIIIGPDGIVKLTDFGIAKSNLSTAMTETGVTFGTADYISPEQARGLTVSPRSDVYSLGVTLYEMLTGRLPFSGDSSIAVAMQHVSADPPLPRMYNPRITPQLEALVLAAMAKEPAERPASAREFARLLRTYRTSGEQETMAVRAPAPRAPVTAPPAPTPRAPAPAPRTPLPAPRTTAAAPAMGGGGREIGLFVLGMIVLGVVLFGVYLFATGTFDGMFNFASGPRPTPPAAFEPTPTPESGATPTPSTEIVVPNVLNRDEQAALQIFETSNLRAIADPSRYNDTVPAGIVFDQLPRPGEVISDTSIITYVVSLGPELLMLPQVVTMREQDAAFQLRGLGFEVQSVLEPDRLSEGFVFRMEPQAGVRLRRGDTVTIYVSLGDKVRMPDVTGMTEDEARRRIESIGLFLSFSDYQGCDKLGALCDRFQPGEVVSSIPRSGELIERGSGVTLGVRSLDKDE